MSTPVDELLNELGPDTLDVGAGPSAPAEANSPPPPKPARMLPPPGGPHFYAGNNAVNGVDVAATDVAALEAEGWTKEKSE